MKYLIFRNRYDTFSIPFSEIQKPRVRRLLDKCIIIETQKDLLGVIRKRAYRIVKRKPKPIRRTIMHGRTRPTFRPMNLGMQRSILERRARKFGVASDVLDWDRLDNTLGFSENRRVMEEQIRRLSGRNDLFLEEIDVKTGRSRHRGRSVRTMWDELS